MSVLNETIGQKMERENKKDMKVIHVWCEDRNEDLSQRITEALDKAFEEGYINPQIQYQTTSFTEFQGASHIIFSALITLHK